jgi:hypothetical protein
MDPSPERGHESCLVLHREDDTTEQEEAFHVDPATLPIDVVDPDPLSDLSPDCEEKFRGQKRVGKEG